MGKVSRRNAAGTVHPVPGPWPSTYVPARDPPEIRRSWIERHRVRLSVSLQENTGSFSVTVAMVIAAFPVTGAYSFEWDTAEMRGTTGQTVRFVHVPTGFAVQDSGVDGSVRPAVGMRSSQLSRLSYLTASTAIVLFAGTVTPATAGAQAILDLNVRLLTGVAVG
jgi:hypothetical protein